MDMQLTFNQNYVYWIYEGQKIEVKAKDIFFAANKEGRYIYIECGKNYMIDVAYYYDLKGSLILSYSIKEGIICIGNKKIHINELKLASYYPNQNTILLLVGEKGKKMICYNLEGIRLFETEDPIGYEMRYFQTNGKEIYVVCDSDKQDADKYGRFTYSFLIDLSTGKLTKGSLSY